MVHGERVGLGQQGAGRAQAWLARPSAISFPGMGWSTWEGTQKASVGAVRIWRRDAAWASMSWLRVRQVMIAVGSSMSLHREPWTPLGSMKMNREWAGSVARRAYSAACHSARGTVCRPGGRRMALILEVSRWTPEPARPWAFPKEPSVKATSVASGRAF